MKPIRIVSFPAVIRPLFLVFLLALSHKVLADTTIIKTVFDTSINTKIKSIEVKVDTSLSRIKDFQDNAKLASKCIPCLEGKVEGGEWIIVFLPGIFFLVLLITLMKSGLAGFDLKKAMSESTFPTIIERNLLYDSANLTNAELTKNPNLQEILPATIETTYMMVQNGTNVPPDPHPSVSRYIAFISSLLTIVVALGVSCFYLYFYIKTGCSPEISGLSTLLIALGLGVIPYVVNKVSSAVKKNPEQV